MPFALVSTLNSRSASRITVFHIPPVTEELMKIESCPLLLTLSAHGIAISSFLLKKTLFSAGAFWSARFFQGAFDPFRCHGKLAHDGPRGIVHRRGQHAAHADNGRFAAAFGRQCRIGDNHGFDVGKP